MRIEVERGGLINQPKLKAHKKIDYDTDQKQEKQEGPGLLGRLGVQAVRGFEAPGKFLDTLLEFAGEPKLMQGALSEDLAKRLGVTSPEQLESKSIPEHFAHRFLSQAPSAAVLGGLPSVASTAIGSAGATGAKALGAPEFVQDIAQLGTELGTGLVKGKFPSISKAQKEAYETTRGLAPEGIRAAAKPISDSLKSVSQKLGTEVNKSIKDKVSGIIETVDENLFKKTISPKNAMDLRKSINSYVKTLPEEAKHYAYEINNGINDFFSVYAAENPKFFDSLKKADQLTEMKNMQSYIGKFLENGKLPGLTTEWGGLIKLPIALTSKITVEPVEKFLRRISTIPAAKEYYFDLVKNAAEGSTVSFAKNLNNLKNELLEPESHFKLESKPTKKIEILRGGKL